MSYQITTHLVHLTAIGDTTITTTASVVLSPDSGYELPLSKKAIMVTNADFEYDSSTGIISLSSPTGNVTITAFANLSVDITTLAGYVDLDAGYHTLSIVAKADNFLDSEPSEPITFYKLVTPFDESISEITTETVPTEEQVNYYFVASANATSYRIYATDTNGHIFELGDVDDYDYERVGQIIFIFNAPFEVFNEGENNFLRII